MRRWGIAPAEEGGLQPQAQPDRAHESAFAEQHAHDAMMPPLYTPPADAQATAPSAADRHPAAPEPEPDCASDVTAAPAEPSGPGSAGVVASAGSEERASESALPDEQPAAQGDAEVSGSVLRQLQREMESARLAGHRSTAQPPGRAAAQDALGGAIPVEQQQAVPQTSRDRFCNHANLPDQAPSAREPPSDAPLAQAPGDAAARVGSTARSSSACQPSSGSGQLSEEAKRAMLQACAPLAEHTTWLCNSLYTPSGGAACGGLLTAAPVRTHGGPAGRQVLQVRVRGTPVDFCLPALSDAEREEVAAVEQLLASAEYDSSAIVPIFWDTETTGLASYQWFARDSSRIVQIAAVADEAAGQREFEVKCNPWPVQMSPGAAAATGLSTPRVFGHALPPQVRPAP